MNSYSHAPNIIVEREILKRKTIAQKPQIDASLQITIGNNTPIRLPFKSFVKNLGYLLAFKMFAEANAGLIKDTAGNVITADRFKMEVTEAAISAAANTLYGIWIGYTGDFTSLYTQDVLATMSNSIKETDFSLYRKIPNDGMIPDSDVLYGATSVTLLNTGALKVARTITVNRTNGIRINEIGLIGNVGTEKVLLCRDFIFDVASNRHYINVPFNELIRIEYVFNIVSGSGFTSRFIGFLNSLFTGASVTDFLSTTGVNRAVDVNTDTIDFMAAATVITHGILVGGGLTTDINTPKMRTTDYVMINPVIPNNVLTYGAMTLIPLSYVNGRTLIGCYRDFTNESATATVYVAEDAIYFKDSTLEVGNDITDYFMMNNTSVGTTGYQAVLPGETLRIKYYYAFPIGIQEIGTSAV